MTWRERGARVLREPLVHFLLAGAAIFALFGGESAPDERRIVIDAPRVERLAGQFAQNFRRAPAPAELDALIREDVKDEVYYREALRLGLDRDDAVVRNRMRRKMEAFADDADALPAPDDATLQRWLDAHPQRFAGEPSYSFEQRGFGGGANPLPARLERASASEVAELFGEAFPAELDRLPRGAWTKVATGVGALSVRLAGRYPAPPPRLAEIRQRVENDWRATVARSRTQRAYQALLDGYQVVIERPT